MRSFIRHPSDIPIEVSKEEIAVPAAGEHLKNVSAGGLSFTSEVPFDEGSVVQIKIALVRPVFEAKGKVTWCKKEDGYFDVGIEFIETRDAFKARMVEQICHIEHYKREIYEKEGRTLSGKEAALEWISKYATTFQPEIAEKK